MAAKYEILAAQLRRLCTRMKRRGETKLPSETELAAQTGNSRQTIRHALRMLEEEGLIGRVRGSGTYLSDEGEKKAARVAVLVSSADTYLYPQLIRDIEAVCHTEGLQTAVFPTGNEVMKEREVLQSLLRDLPAGILMEAAKSALPSPNLDLLSAMERHGIPLVFLSAPLPVPGSAPCIRADNEGGAGMLVRYLLGKGRRRIGGIFRSDELQSTERYQGFISELIRSSCPVDENAILWYDTEDQRHLLREPDRLPERINLSRLSDCDALVCCNDEIAYHLIRHLLKAGVRVPEDMAVVSFDNSHYCLLSPVSITSLTHEKHQPGRAAAEALLNLINEKSARSARLSWTLRERASG